MTQHFHTRYTANKKVYDIIIDGGNRKNIVSKVIVAKLGMKTEKHPSPYKIGWIKHGTEIEVNEIC